jgi:magnesium transporter
MIRRTHFAGGTSASRLVESLRDASVFMLYRARIVWLVVLVFGNIFSGAGIAYFEDTISAYVALVFFLPLLIDSGGNAGSQSATLMVRSLATGDVQLADWGRMMGREVAVAALMGLTMALAVSLIGVVRAGPEIAVVVALSMVVIVIVGSVIGMTLPFILTRLNLDPATASAPLVTSIADAAGVLIYFTIATAFLFPSM